MAEKTAPSFLEDKLPEPKTLVVDELQKKGLELVGVAMMGQPKEMAIILDYTGLRGSGSNVFWTFTHRVGKLRYSIKKVDEWMEINPNYTELYNQMLGQKQRIEGAIKSSLASVAQSVADYELLKHDGRRYREVLDYFQKGQKDQHVLRSLFVDRVDAYTGEGYSMVTMAKRWPTIITDFIRMKEEWEDVNLIRKELDVSQAEATVLKTKNELFKEWKTLFLPTVKERYARIQTMVRARQRSVDEYKSWLRPYIAKYKAMKEHTEGADKSWYVSSAFSTPGFGTMDAWSFVRFWVWRPFYPVEAGKPEAVVGREGKGFIYDPYDDFVKGWKKKIEAHYGVTITDEDVRSLLENALKQHEMAHCSDMEPGALYYLLFDVKVLLNTLKSPPPEGVEMDNIMFIPVKVWVMSQNCMLVHLLEVYARNKWMEKYMDELIGARSIEEDIYKSVEEEFEQMSPKKGKDKNKGKKPEQKRAFLGARYAFDKDMSYRPNLAMRFIRFFVKPGPYENVFYERASKMYMRASGFYFKQLTDVIKSSMGIE